MRKLQVYCDSPLYAMQMNTGPTWLWGTIVWLRHSCQHSHMDSRVTITAPVLFVQCGPHVDLHRGKWPSQHLSFLYSVGLTRGLAQGQVRRCEFPLGTHKLKVVLTVWDSTQGLAVDKGTRLGEEEERNEDNYSDCAVGMHRGQAQRLHNIQKC